MGQPIREVYNFAAGSEHLQYVKYRWSITGRHLLELVQSAIDGIPGHARKLTLPLIMRNSTDQDSFPSSDHGLVYRPPVPRTPILHRLPGKIRTIIPSLVARDDPTPSVNETHQGLKETAPTTAAANLTQSKRTECSITKPATSTIREISCVSTTISVIFVSFSLAAPRNISCSLRRSIYDIISRSMQNRRSNCSHCAIPCES